MPCVDTSQKVTTRAPLQSTVGGLITKETFLACCHHYKPLAVVAVGDIRAMLGVNFN